MGNPSYEHASCVIHMDDGRWKIEKVWMKRWEISQLKKCYFYIIKKKKWKNNENKLKEIEMCMKNMQMQIN